MRAYIIWLPIFGGDFKGEARKLSSGFQDKRVSYFLDPESETGTLWEPLLKTPSIAWDVYMLYGPDARWGDQPPKPIFWMHQLGMVSGAPRLDQPAFEARLRALVDELKAPSGTQP